MSKQKNLRYQFIKAINENFREGIDKHSYKAQNPNVQSNLIFSHTSRINLKKMAINFSGYMKENYPEVRQVKDINQEHVQKFLESKSNSCNDTTLRTYAGNMRKLEKAINKTYDSANLNYSNNIKVPKSNYNKPTNRGVSAQMPRENYNKILDVAAKASCQSAYAVRLQEHLGVRVAELATIKKDNINLECSTPYIHFNNTKGGRAMDRPLNQDAVKLVREIMDKNFDQDKLFSNNSSSFNKYLRDVEDTLGIERNSMHDVRRLVAQEFYNNLKNNGYSTKEAADAVSVWLNHNKDREELLKKSYINLW